MEPKRYFNVRIPLPSNTAWIRRLLPTPGNVIFTLLVVGSLLWAANAGALPLRAPLAAPASSTGTIAYQGRLADSGGAPLTGTYSMIFRLYSAAAGGVPLWEEQWTGPNSVRVSDGLFNVMLGSLTPIPPGVITGNDSLWLGITVGTDDEMAPRVQLGSVPFAVQALTVPDGSITTAKLADGSVTTSKLVTQSVTTAILDDGSVTTAKLADGAVTTEKMATGAVTTTVLADKSVTSAKLDKDLVIGDKLTIGDNDPGYPLNRIEVKNGRIGFYNGSATEEASGGFGQFLCTANPSSYCDFYTGYGAGGLILVHEWHANWDGWFGQKLYMFTGHSTSNAIITQIATHGANYCSIAYVEANPLGWHRWRMTNTRGEGSGCHAYYIRVH